MPLAPQVALARRRAASTQALGAQGRGIVFLTPHLGCFEVTAQAYAERCGALGPMTVLYRPARKAVAARLVDAARARPGLATAPATLAGVRQMMRALRRGEAVGLLPDQVPPEGMGVWAPFFGRPAYTMTLAARLRRSRPARRRCWPGASGCRAARGYVRARRAPSTSRCRRDADGSGRIRARAINRAMER